MKTIRIWFNHWFSTAYHIVNLIKQDENIHFYVIGSSTNPDSVVKEVCDEWYSEYDGQDEDGYISFCLDFCSEHNIDIFLPRRNQLMISKHKPDFEKAGIKVLVDDYEKIYLFHDKAAAYQLFTQKNIGIVPEYRITKNSSEFAAAFEELSKRHDKLCIKFTSDEGGESFRIVETSPMPPFKRAGCHIEYEKLLNDIDSVKNCPPIMLMPYLPDNEVSVDCLKTSHGIIMIPRIKGFTRTEYINYDPDILKMCENFYKKFGLEHPCNIQFKYSEGIPYFLEINTRMSGGIQLTCLASGINIPNLAVNKLMGIEKTWKSKQEYKKVTHIETPIILK